MRVISGEWRGRKLLAPKGDATRPTADRTRETLRDQDMYGFQLMTPAERDEYRARMRAAHASDGRLTSQAA